MKRALFIYNPLSGNRLVPRELDRIIEKFQENDIFLDMYRIAEDNSKIIEAMHRKDIDMIIGAGGDGTIGNVANWMIKEGIKLPYGTLGTGTCNNFTHNIDIPEDMEKAIDIICQGHSYSVDVGIVNSKHSFLSSLAGGMFVEASFKTEPELKQKLGPFAYYLKALSELANLKSYPLEIDTGSDIYKENAYLVMILNGTHVGSFKRVFSESQIDISDGLMEMLVLREGNPIEIANMFLMMMRGEDYLKSDSVLLLKSDYFKISSTEKVNMSIDGEKGPMLPIEVEVRKEAIEVFVPKTKL